MQDTNLPAWSQNQQPAVHDYYCEFIKKPAITAYVVLIIRERSEKDTSHSEEKK